MMYKTLIASLLPVVLMMAFDAAASSVDDAVDAMRTGDFAEAYCIMRPLADSGDADAQYNIGWMYMNGYGLRINDRLALAWWQKASEQGHSDASFSIGMLYSLGEGEIDQDSDKAIDYYLMAAADGHEDAVAILKSMMLRNDDSVRDRLYTIIKDHESLFGVRLRVKATKLNARDAPSTESEVVTRLSKGEDVLELNRQGLWSQVLTLGEKEINQTIWVYNPLLEDIAAGDAPSD